MKLKLKNQESDNLMLLYITVGIVFVLIMVMNIYAYRVINSMGKDYTSLGVLSKGLKVDLESAQNNLFEIVRQGKGKNLEDHVHSYLKKAKIKADTLGRISKLKLDSHVVKMGEKANEAYSEKGLEKKNYILEQYAREVKTVIARLDASEEERSALINNETSFISFIYIILIIGNLLAFGGIFFVIFINGRSIKAKEAKLNSANANFYAIMQGLDSILISFDSTGKVQTWNSNAWRYFDIEEKDAIGKNIYELVPAFQPFRGFFDKVMYSMQRHYNYHERMHVNKGPGRIVDMLCVPLVSSSRLKKSTQKALLVKMDDVTSFSTEEAHAAQLRNSELVSSSMEIVIQESSSLHAQAGGILQTINEISAMHGISEEVAPYTAYLNNTLAELSGIPQKYASSLHVEKLNNIQLDLNELIMYVLRICLKIFDPSVNVEVSQNESKSWILADPLLLSKALFCLMNNAAEALTEMKAEGEPRGGIISVSVEKIEGEKIVCDRVMRFRHTVKEPPYWVVMISDNGPGIPAEIQPKIFDMFFTTKNSEQHKGLGLSFVANIVNALGGFVDINSKSGNGMVFKIYLPEMTDASHEAEFEPAVNLTGNDSEIVYGQGTVLFVGDDIFMRQITARLLEKFGYQVIMSENGFEALDIYAQDLNSGEKNIQCVVSNLTNGLIRNLELASNLKQMNPDLPIVVQVNSENDDEAVSLREIGVTDFVRKPYSMSDFSQVLAKYLGQKNDPQV